MGLHPQWDTSVPSLSLGSQQDLKQAAQLQAFTWTVTVSRTCQTVTLGLGLATVQV